MDLEELTDEQIVEDILALDELSKTTLGSYIKRASFGPNGFGMNLKKNHISHMIGNHEKGNKDFKKMIKRINGIRTATDKLTKEQKEFIGNILEELEQEEISIMENTLSLVDAIIAGNSMDIDSSFEALMSEKITERLDNFKKEVAQGMFTESTEELSDEQIVEDILALDEISKKTLGSYIKGATGGINGVAANAYAMGQNSIKHSSDVNSKTANEKIRKTFNRIKGITKATSRLTKEQKETIETVLEELELEQE